MKKPPPLNKAFLMRCMGYARDMPCPYEGMYLAQFTPDGESKGEWTSNQDKAIHFVNPESLLETWKMSIGTREDGKPDRPLTAFNIEIEEVNLNPKPLPDN